MNLEYLCVFSPNNGHLVFAVEVANLLVHQDKRISVGILILKSPGHTGVAAFAENLKNDAPDCVNFVNVPALDESIMIELMSLPHNSFLDSFILNQRTEVKDVVKIILNRSESTKLGGFMLGMFCTTMIEVANDFDVPDYVFFTSGYLFLASSFMIKISKITKV